MDTKEALQKEIDVLRGKVLKSFEYADSQGDIMIGKLYRQWTKDMIASYERILKSLA